MRSLTMFILILALASTTTFATIPKTMSYQGMLRDHSGNIVPDGNYNVIFRLYDVESGGTAIWVEPDTVLVTDGVFSTILGDLNALDLAFDRQYWLSIEVGATGELLPRIQLTSSPYARVAGGIDLPYSRSVSSVTPAFSVTNINTAVVTAVEGNSQYGYGLHGKSTGNTGVLGEGKLYGVFGDRKSVV